MRAVVQRVREAAVRCGPDTVGAVKEGLLVYVGVAREDTDDDVRYLADKVAHLRIFADDAGVMNRSARDVGAHALVVSQFTLLGDVRRGRRPSYAGAMEPEAARHLFDAFVATLEDRGVPCATGRYRAHMHVHSVNDGPVTILLDSRKAF